MIRESGVETNGKSAMSVIETWSRQLEEFLEPFGHHFVRPEVKRTAFAYVRSLLSKTDRKNSWQLAEAGGFDRPDKFQRLLYKARWDECAFNNDLSSLIAQTFNHPQGVLILDETGFIKQGKKSAGVARQYSGTAGKIENCQIGVFLAYDSPKGHPLLDRRLYLPQEWCEDRQRRESAKIPNDIQFKTKVELAIDMLEQAVANGVEAAWLTGDEVYGNASELRQKSSELDLNYVLAVSKTTRVWLERPRVEKPGRYHTRGVTRKSARVSSDSPKPKRVEEVVANWDGRRWRKFAAREGAKGPITYEWGRLRVTEKHGTRLNDGLPGEDVWLLARRSCEDPKELAYYLCLCPRSTALKTLAKIATSRSRIEQCFKEAKGEVGLDEYEVRFWHSWYRHMTLCMTAYAWLNKLRKDNRKKI